MRADLAWKFSRLRAMGAAEIDHRARQAVAARLESRGFGLAKIVPAPRGSAGKPWVERWPEQIDAGAVVAAADALLAGRFDVFALESASLGFPPRWNRDPLTGTDVPLAFGKALDYRDERVVGNIKYLWEINRHGALVTLAQAWRLRGEERFAQGCGTLLASWFDQCPYPLGPNWSSALELALRLVSWSVAWHLLGGEGADLFAGAEGQAFKGRWLDAIYRHCHFIVHNFSRYSSANNHLFGELLGVFVASLTWPLWVESAGWTARTHAELEAEALRQNAPDGVNREQALYYHHTVADQMLFALCVGQTNGVPFSAAFRGRLESMLEVLAAVMDSRGHVPMIGDADDAVLVPFSHAPGWCPYRSLLATGAVLFRRGDFKSKGGAFDDKSRWLLGDEAGLLFDALRPELGGARREFPEGGLWVLGDRLDTPDEIRVVADAGPLGYLSIAAHGHADALAFTLSVGGEEILIDAGTYSYHTEQIWRDYFRGTRAHNTVCIDDLDQSVSGGNFLWLRHAQARCARWEPGVARDVWTGVHDGYQRLPDPVAHRRTLTLDKVARVLVVEDVLVCRGRHQVALHWHLHEDSRVDIAGGAIRVRRGLIAATLSMPGSAWSPQVVRGREAPPLGWVSRRFDQKAPAPTALWSGEITGTARLRTEFRLETGPGPKPAMRWPHADLAPDALI